MDVADLAEVVEFRFDVVDLSPEPIPSHKQTCPNLASHTDNCNYVADAANLCVEEHSEQWIAFTDCMYDYAKFGDFFNPMTKEKKFDTSIAKCAASLSDYAVEDVRACTYGQEGGQLRAASKAKFEATGASSVVWVEVAGQIIEGPPGSDITTPRDDWAKQVVAAICAAHDGAMPSSCVDAALI